MGPWQWEGVRHLFDGAQFPRGFARRHLADPRVDSQGNLLSEENRYFISSLNHQRLSFAHWLELVRRHWQVEVTHNILDTSFQEDERPWLTHSAQGMLVMLLLRRVVVLYGAQDRARANSVAEAFQAAGIPAIVSLPAALDPHAGNVLYVLPGSDFAAIHKYCFVNRALSISGTPAMVERGDVSLALGVGGGGRTEIWVHLPRLKEEGHEFDSGLLRLAHIIQ